uniref:Uncharacterized protein n=1 Tax=Megaselia scalaris TaxID=36166 RepID=T1H3F1_MEGSC
MYLEVFKIWKNNGFLSMFCILLRVHLTSLTGRLIQHSIENVDWMKEILECRKILMHVNNRIAIPVSFLAVTNLSYGFAALTYLFKEYDFRDSASKDNLLHIANILLCFSIGTFPFFQAGLVTSACKTVKDNGHQIRVRPFVYNNTNTDDLNSTLLFASTLNMSAKLFGMPIQTNYLAFIC